jgi:hypothetical protein
MSVYAGAERTAFAAPRIATERLRLLFLWLIGFAGAFVFVEPSPYELVGLATIFLFALTGLSLRPGLMPLLLLLIGLNVGYAVAMVQVIDQSKPVIWVMVSAFLATTAIFYAAMLGTNTEARLRWLLRGYIAAALTASLIGIAAYFRLLGGMSDIFLLYDRARATFNDPNVLGAFLVLPALLLFQRILLGRLSAVIGNSGLLLVLLAGLFLSFSRAAWGQFAFCALVIMALSFISTRSASERLRIVAIAIAGIITIALFVAVLLSIGQIAELFKERASLEQSYDLGHYGRFGRYLLGAQLGLERPLGIGPLQFSRFFPEDAHNTFLNSFMSGGWLSGFAYLTLTLVTIFVGLRFVLVPTPWRPTYQVVYAAFLGAAAESAIIDIDHWRHYFLILGVLWGLIVMSRAYSFAARKEHSRQQARVSSLAGLAQPPAASYSFAPIGGA